MIHLNVVNAISCNQLFGTGPNQFRRIRKITKFSNGSNWTFPGAKFLSTFFEVECGQMRSNAVKFGFSWNSWWNVTQVSNLESWPDFGFQSPTVHPMIKVWKYYHSINRLWKNSIQKVINRCEKNNCEEPRSWPRLLRLPNGGSLIEPRDGHVTVPCSLKLCA